MQEDLAGVMALASLKSSYHLPSFDGHLYLSHHHNFLLGLSRILALLLEVHLTYSSRY